MNKPASRLMSWTQPKRPEWVARLNEEGGWLDIAGIVPLDEDSLIAYAKANTGLDDFGADDWRDPFRVLLKGIEEEARLTLMGRILTRTDLLMFLEARLRIEDAYKRHPEIEEEEIVRPLWVIGQGRSGTSLLHTLLAQPPANRTTTDCDGMFPVRWTEDSVDPRHELAHARATQWSRVVPEVNSIHEFDADTPCETFRLEAHGFRAPAWLNLLGLAPSYNAYLASQSYEPALRYGKRIYKLMQWQDKRRDRQWVLRSNDSIQYLPLVLKVFPDACLVWSHRDPVKALASMVDMIGTMMWIRSDQRLAAAYEQVTNPVAAAPMLTQPVDWLESGEIPRDRLYNIQYPDLIRDPVGAVKGIYDHFGMEFSAETRKAIADYMTAHPRTKRPSHRYSLPDPEQVCAERAAFKRYQDYFGVASEQD